MVDLQHLRVFVAVSRHGTVAHAARALHLTASPVSRTLGDLERVTGPLFSRGYHVMALTDQGRRLLPTAVSIVGQADDLLTLARGEELELRCAATPWVPASLAEELADAVERSGRSREVDAAVSSALLHRMEHGEVDVALVHLPVQVPGIATLPLARYAFDLAMASGDPLAGREVVTGADLAGRDVLMLPRTMQPDAMAGLQAWLEACGVASVQEVPLDEVPSLSSRLRRTGAVSPTVTTPDGRVQWARDVVLVPLVGESVDFLVGIAWRTDDRARTPRLDALADALRRPGGTLDVIGSAVPRREGSGGGDAGQAGRAR